MNSHFVIVILSLFVLFLGCVGQGPSNTLSPNNQNPATNTGTQADETYDAYDEYDEYGYGSDDSGYGLGDYETGMSGDGYGGTATTGTSLDSTQAFAAAGPAFPSPTTIVGAFVSANHGWVLFDAQGNAKYGGWDGQPLANGMTPGSRTYQLNGNQITYQYVQYTGQVSTTTYPFEIINDGKSGPASFSENGTTYTRVDYPLTGLALSGKYYNYNVSQYGSPSAYGDSYSSTSTSKTYYTFSPDGSVVREGKGTFSSTSVNKDQYGTGENQDIYGNYYDEQTTTDGATGGSSKSGTYSIQGNKLLIQYSDGSGESAVIAVPDLSQAQSGMLYLDDLPFVRV